MENGRARVASQLGVSALSADDILAESGWLDTDSMSLWAVLPVVARRLGNPQEAPAAYSPAQGRMRNLGRALMRGRGPDLTRVGPVLFLTSGIQTARVLWPVIDELANTLGPPGRYHLPPLNPREAAAAQLVARRSHQALRRWLRRVGSPEPVGLEEEVAKVEVMLRRTRAAAFSEDGVRVIVVATQHNGPTRAVLAATAGTPGGPATCYLPHAPVADNAYYRDLPVNYALLHGPAEVDFYRRCGVDDAARVRVVGQPGLGASQSGGHAEDPVHLVYAASGYEDRVLRADIEVVLRGVDRPVEVCLHPMMSLRGARGLFPSEWTVHPPGPTIEVLRSRGALALIQHGSGVGLEAMSAGIDVIDLCPAEDKPNYPYITPPYVQIASDDVGLRGAIDAIPGRRETRGDRIRFAKQWCSILDPEASVAAASAIRSIAEEQRPSDLLLDGWGVHATR